MCVMCVYLYYYNVFVCVSVCVCVTMTGLTRVPQKNGQTLSNMCVRCHVTMSIFVKSLPSGELT